MKTKLEELIKRCIENGAPLNGCEGCACNEKECLICLIEEYNDICEENECIEWSE